MSGPTSTELDELARKDEAQYVHQVYETIASHFSNTRYKVGLLLNELYTLTLADLHGSDSASSFPCIRALSTQRYTQRAIF